MDNETIYFGLKLTELISIIAVITGPIIAVVISMWWQNYNEKRSRRLNIVQTIWDTHHDASHPSFSGAIRSIPIVFNNDQSVRVALNKFMDNVNSKPTTENQLIHNQTYLDCKNDLLIALTKSVGFSLTEREVRDSIYVPNGVTDNVKLQKDTQEAIIRIADAIEAKDLSKNSDKKNNNAQKY